MPVVGCMERLLQPVFVACDCNLLRNPHSGSCRLQVIAKDQDVPGCRASKDGRLRILAKAVLANSRLAAGDCTVL